MKIAICEDEEIMAKKLWNLFVADPETEADYFLDPLELLENYHTAGQYQILLCDATMKPMDGIALCRKIREFDFRHVTLDNGKTLPISSRKSALFKKRLYQFLSEGSHY